MSEDGARIEEWMQRWLYHYFSPAANQFQLTLTMPAVFVSKAAWLEWIQFHEAEGHIEVSEVSPSDFHVQLSKMGLQEWLPVIRVRQKLLGAPTGLP